MSYPKDGLYCVNLAISSSEVAWSVPTEKLCSLVLQAYGGDIHVRHVASGANFTLLDGQPLPVNLENVNGQELLFIAVAGDCTLQILIAFGAGF